MPAKATQRWTISVSNETDVTVRNFLGERGLDEAEFSKFVEEAVKWRVFDQTLGEAREKFVDLTPRELETLLEEAVEAARRPGVR